MLDNYERWKDVIYGGILEQQPFVSFLGLLNESLNAARVTLVLRWPSVRDSGLIISPQGNTDATKLFQEHFFELSPFKNIETGRVYILRDILSQAELEESDYFKGLMQPSGLGDLMGCDVEAKGVYARIRITAFESEAGFSEQDRLLLQETLGDFMRALGLYSTFAEKQSELMAYNRAVDELGLGLVLLNQHGELILANQPAENFLESSGIRFNKRRLEFSHSGLQELLNNMLEKVQQLRSSSINDNQLLAETCSVESSRHGEGSHWNIMMKPYKPPELGEGVSFAAITIMIKHSQQGSNVTETTVRNLFALTHSEAAVAAALASGKTLDETAETLGVARNTVRSHLYAIFAKTGVKKQSALVSLIHNRMQASWD